MNALTPQERDRLLDLLADRAVGDLSPADAAELDALLARTPDEPGYEDAVGDLLLAADDPADGAMPDALRRSLRQRGEGLVGAAADDENPVAGRISARDAGSGSGGGAWIGWTVAAAALLLAFVGWMRPPSGPAVVRPGPEQRLAALEREPDTVVIPLAGQGELEAAGKAGEIVWNPRLQQGFLRLSELPGNDPTEAQYQLWIFDATRETYAVDGGVFNVSAPAAGEAVVPFEPKLAVGRAAAFAVTRERPGGVVVTDQSGLVLLAPVPDGASGG